jgi:hypothetical protein
MVAMKEMTFSPRIVLTKKMMEEFFTKVFKGDVPELSAAKGLPYDLVYNLVHGRIRSLSEEDYRAIFGDEPPRQARKRVGARYFRGMVKLWLFLNRDGTEAELYREFNQGRRFKKVDYRVFSGSKVKSVSAEAERWMEEKFLGQGFKRNEIEEGIAEIESIGYEEKIPYAKIKPVLDYLERFGVSATKVLNQWSARYESGELRNVPKDVYDRAMKVRAKALKASASESPYAVEKLKEEIYGRRKGLTLFSDVESELWCLRKYGRKSIKRYLGRSIKNYEQGKLKRISAGRAGKIREEFEQFMRRRPPIPLLSLPETYRTKEIKRLISAMDSVAVAKLLRDHEGTYEMSVLRPAFGSSKGTTEAGAQQYVLLEEASRVLAMSLMAFDLLLASHPGLFKKLGKYEGKWFFPDSYLDELSRKTGFRFIRAKYEWSAKKAEEARHRAWKKVPHHGKQVGQTRPAAYGNTKTARPPEEPEQIQAVSQ